MLRVRVIRKFHDEKGILIGYTIQDETGKTMDVYKDSLKKAVVSGQVDCVNMTLTSDGRLIGKAAPAPKKRETARNASNETLVELYTNGRNIVGAMIKYTAMNNATSFDVGHEAKQKCAEGWYDNVVIINGKPEFKDVKRKSFKAVHDKLIKYIGETPKFTVEKGDKKGEYVCIIDNYRDYNGEQIQALYCLMEDAFVTLKVNPLYIDEANFFVENITGINDVRKALKTIK